MTIAREQVLKAFHNEIEDTIPASFWRHFADSEFIDGLKHTEVFDLNVNGHKKYIEQTQPDFVKTMSDGFFAYPFQGVKNRLNYGGWKGLETISNDHPWFTGQVRLAQKQKELAGDCLTFYTVFSPMILLKWALIDHETEPLLLSDKRLADFYEQKPDLLKAALTKIAQDQEKLVKKLKNSGIDGIYFSTQSVQDERTDNHKFFDDVMEPVDIHIQNEINKVFNLNVLHICGFAGATNHLDWFINYPLQVINWATDVDGYSLGEGKKLFGDRPVMGGFDNSTKGILYSGTKEEIQVETKRIINEAGRKGIILGADCTIPRDTPIEHIQWAIEAAHNS